MEKGCLKPENFIYICRSRINCTDYEENNSLFALRRPSRFQPSVEYIFEPVVTEMALGDKQAKHRRGTCFGTKNYFF